MKEVISILTRKRASLFV